MVLSGTCHCFADDRPGRIRPNRIQFSSSDCLFSNLNQSCFEITGQISAGNTNVERRFTSFRMRICPPVWSVRNGRRGIRGDGHVFPELVASSTPVRRKVKTFPFCLGELFAPRQHAEQDERTLAHAGITRGSFFSVAQWYANHTSSEKMAASQKRRFPPHVSEIDVALFKPNTNRLCRQTSDVPP